MHLGNARTALLAWLACRRDGGAMVLRLEDLDATRVVPGAADRLLSDLRWLGLDWDEGPDVGGPHAPYLQTQRTAAYDAAIDHLLRTGAAFLCACSRADVNRAASAPHGEALDDASAGPRYPGTCRDQPAADVQARARAAGRAPTVRFRGQAQGLPTSFVDGVRGAVDPLPQPFGIDDFVIRRADGVAAYQLAVVVDDAAMEITHVVRGDDLLSSTPRQLALYQSLALTPPRFFHVPLVLTPAGDRLAKRSRPVSIADLRQRGVSADVIIGALAASANLIPPGQRAAARDLVAGFGLARIPPTAVALDPAQWPADPAP
jgi:glutamyl-tRNA synthetase